MKRTFFGVLISAFLVTGCMVGIGGRHHGVIIVPMLPSSIELDEGQDYYQDGFYYRYQGNIWLYSESREGPWHRLPRDHYPREFHYRNHEHDREHYDHDRDNR